jgi:cyclic beta-1,2-glucan synthetase
MLFLPYFSGSLLRESAHFCVYAHKKAARLSCWGNSESAYYELDGSGRFRYKAHGVPELALKRDMGRDFVVAPYASFLALEIDPDGAYANLRRLEALGAYGKYGFIDAVDFTRAGPGGSPSPVRIYMAHHIGMSLAATANYLASGVLRRRFMRDREMGAFSALLKERVPAVQTPPAPRRNRNALR